MYPGHGRLVCAQNMFFRAPRTGGSAGWAAWAACGHQLVGVSPDKVVFSVHAGVSIGVIELRIVGTDSDEVEGVLDTQPLRR